MQSLRTSTTPSPRKAISALTIRAEEEDGPHGERDSYLAEEGDTYEVFAVGATGWGTARGRTPPYCLMCGKPSVAGSDYLTCCKAWLVQPMFCNLCHSTTRRHLRSLWLSRPLDPPHVRRRRQHGCNNRGRPRDSHAGGNDHRIEAPRANGRATGAADTGAWPIDSGRRSLCERGVESAGPSASPCRRSHGTGGLVLATPAGTCCGRRFASRERTRRSRPITA